MSVKELEGTLKDLEGQCVALERAEAEREAAKSAIAKLEAEAGEAELGGCHQRCKGNTSEWEPWKSSEHGWEGHGWSFYALS